jgi:hypothetical protein
MSDNGTIESMTKIDLKYLLVDERACKAGNFVQNLSNAQIFSKSEDF